MKKILYITYYWPPSGGPGVQRSLKFVKYLYSYGYEPIVITVNPAKASYPVTDHSLNAEIPLHTRVIKTSTFEPFRLYEILTRKKEIPHSGFANEGKPSFVQKLSRFIRGNLFVPDPRKGWNTYVMRVVDELMKTESISAVITSSPPHSSQLIGLKIKQKYKLPWVADLRDPWTDIYYYKSLYHIGFVAHLDATYEKRVLQNADAVLVVSKAIKRLFAAKLTAGGADHIHVLPNGFDAEDFTEPTTLNAKEFTIAYTGTMASSYKITAFLQALKELAATYGQDKIRVKIAGKVSPEITQQIEDYQLTNIFENLGYLKHSAAIKLMQESTALLLVIPDIENNEGILTGKLFEYLASGKPIIGLGPVNGDAAEIINQAQAGSMFDYDDEKGINLMLSTLCNQFQTGRTLFKGPNEKVKQYSRQELTRQLAQILNNIKKA
jgi:glycosyltransferase involved in cell wall biosynthesis